MTERDGRPFYGDFAWAYDDLVVTSTEQQCDFIATELFRRGVKRGGDVFDAGCGTGSHALALAQRGFHVVGLDREPAMIAEARSKAAERPLSVSFVIGDLRDPLPTASYDAILCRGVLNDVIDDRSRDACFAVFADGLRSGGLIVLDVREWHATSRRKTLHPVYEHTIETKRGRLSFRSTTILQLDTRTLQIHEEHRLDGDGNSGTSGYEFAMRCWTHDELEQTLRRHNLVPRIWLGGYDSSVPIGATDRLVVVARRGSTSGRRSVAGHSSPLGRVNGHSTPIRRNL